MTEPANPLDPAAAALRARYPGWRVWYVRRAVGRGAWWSAQPARYPADRRERGRAGRADRRRPGRRHLTGVAPHVRCRRR